MSNLLGQPFDVVDISILEKRRYELDKYREKVSVAHDNYYSNLESLEEINEAYRCFDIRDRKHFLCRTRINERIRALEERRTHDNNMLGLRSSKSAGSSDKSISSVRSRRAKAAGKAASLQIDMDFIDKEAGYIRQQTLKEIAKAKVEEKVFKKFEEHEERNMHAPHSCPERTRLQVQYCSEIT